MMFEEVLIQIGGCNQLSHRFLSAFLAKFDARKSDGSNKGAVKSLQEI